MSSAEVLVISREEEMPFPDRYFLHSCSLCGAQAEELHEASEWQKRTEKLRAVFRVAAISSICQW